MSVALRQRTGAPVRLQLAFVALMTVAAACSGAEIDAATSQNVQPARNLSDTVDDNAPAATTIPEVIAFIEEPVTLRVGVPRLDYVDPHTVDETDPVAVLVADVLTDGLTQIDASTGLAAPALADTWRVSDDGRTWTFVLGTHTFSNGAQVTPEDVVASLNRVAAQGINSLTGPSLWPIEGWLDASSDDVVSVSGIRVASEDEVEIVLSTPFADLAEVLASVLFGVVPADEARPDVAAGEFPLTSATTLEPVALWEDGIRLQGEEVPGEISAIELYVDPEGSLLAAGEVDLGVGLDPTLTLPGVERSTSERSGHVFFAMDASDAPLNDPLIRQAILHTIDRETIRDEFFPGFAVMDGFTPGATDDTCARACGLDLEQAQTLVEASTNSDEPLTVDYFFDVAPEDVAAGVASAEEALATAIVAALNEVGLDATAVGHDPAEYGTLAANGELGLFRFGTVSTSSSRESDLAAMFGTNGPDNITGISIDRLDDALAEARNALDGAERQRAYSAAERIVFGEAALAPLVTLHHDVWFGKNLSSAGLEPDGSLDLTAFSVVLDQFVDE